MLLPRLQSSDDRIRVVQHGIHGKHTVFTDSRKNLAGYPALELLGIRHLAGEDETVKTRFVDDGGFLCSELGGDLPPSFVLIINMVSDGFLRFCVPQNLSHVFTDETRLTLPPTVMMG